MIINVDNFIDGETREVSFSKSISIPVDYSVKGNADTKVFGEISNNGGKFRFRGNVSSVLSVNCDLCLKPFDIELSFNVDETFSNDNKSDEEDGYWSFSEKTINLEPAIVSGIILNVPMKAVCSDKCKGLCNICGHNLNEGECGCERTYINPKFEKLKALFQENEEEV